MFMLKNFFCVKLQIFNPESFGIRFILILISYPEGQGLTVCCKK
jgi:hypothetical protein